MDGNGRWAQRLGLPRIEGHRQGAETVRRITERCGVLGIEQLTLYCLSSENWKRPAEELEFLLALLIQYLRQEREHLSTNRVRLRTIGRVDQLSTDVQAEISESIAATAGQTGICLCLAINYGARAEIAEAVREIATKARAGQIDPDEIDERVISEHLFTANMPDRIY
jgi:undecaprenyl diphosphate synthase